MAVLGKRKARAEPAVSEEDAAAIFRRHFEAQFSLPDSEIINKTKTATSTDNEEEEEDDDDDDDDDDVNEEDDDDDDDDDEWGGLSDGEESSEEEEEAPTIEVVDHSSSKPTKINTMSKRELKAFMSSRPPDQTVRTPEQPSTPTSTASSTLPEDAPSLLAQDLELRRLISESHLLAPAFTPAGANTTPKAFAAGRTRHKATDLRVQALGSTVSIHKQEKMPMNMRKGIVAAAGAREAKRRREAKENGIILERETSKKKGGRRDRSALPVDRPGVGRLKGAELRISDRDIRNIEGSRDTFGRRGRR